MTWADTIDLTTPNVEAAAAYARHHSHEPDRPDVTAADVPEDRPHKDHCTGPGCWACELLKRKLARIAGERP